jgi:outer membrane immunogenic protein
VGCSTLACSNNLGFGPPINLSGDFTRVTSAWDYSFRLRLGYSVLPDVLLYATGGAAFQKIETSMACTGATSPACAFNLAMNQSETLSGYTIGGGVDWKLWQHWIVRGEYRYSDYGTWNPQTFFQNSGVIEVKAGVHVHSQMANLGLAYLIPPRW